MYIFYVDNLLIIQVASSDDTTKFIAYISTAVNKNISKKIKAQPCEIQHKGAICFFFKILTFA